MRQLLVIICMLYLPIVSAKDYGAFGKTYVIAEQDFLEYIQQKIKSMQASGAWDALQSGFKERVEQRVLRPTPHALPKAVETRTWFFNPSISVPYDVKDNKGVVIVKKGTVVNPLDRVSLSSTLLFFDGDDAAQVAWVEYEQQLHQRVKLILTTGSIKDAVNHFKQAIYFDLNGFLIAKFQIKALPARVLQKDKRLEVCEVVV